MDRGFKCVAPACALAGLLYAAPAAALPVFARIYGKPCGTCHTVFPQLNPVGEDFRAHGMHGLPPAIKPLPIGPDLDVPGTLPVALYFASGEDVTHVDVPGQRDPTETHFNLNFLSVLAGGEIGSHLAFLVDYRVLETEPDSGRIETYSEPYQAYAVAHGEGWGWLGNVKGGWYELPLGVSPVIHRLSARPYLIYGLNACSLLGSPAPHGACEDEPTLGETQIGTEVSGLHPATGFGWAAGLTNGSDNRVSGSASQDGYLHLSKALGLHRLGFFLFYSPDIIGYGVHDHTVRIGPDVDLYTRQLRLLGQFLAEYEADPTGHHQSLWYYGGFLEADHRVTPALLALVRIDYAWSPRFDDRMLGGDTRVEPRLWELTVGAQWSVWENLKLVAEVSYGEDRDAVSNQTTTSWAGTIRLVTAFWPLEPPGLENPVERSGTP